MAGELGYNIGRKWWRQGITSEAAQAVLDFAFGVVGFHRIEAIHAVANPGSGGVMKKCGMRYEGSPARKNISATAASLRTATSMPSSRKTGRSPAPKVKNLSFNLSAPSLYKNKVFVHLFQAA